MKKEKEGWETSEGAANAGGIQQKRASYRAASRSQSAARKRAPFPALPLGFEGDLTGEEHAAYQGYAQANKFIAVLQAKAEWR